MAVGAVTGIDHLGIVVRSIAAAVTFWGETLALEEVALEDHPSVRFCFLQVGPSSTIELIEPLEAESPLAAWVADHGEGLHHIALRTDAIDEALEDLRGLRCLSIDAATRDGSRGTRIAFFEPGWAGAPIMELVQW